MSEATRSWTIQIEGPDKVLDAAIVPLHRLEEVGVKRLLKTLVLKYESLTFQETVFSSLNGRKGGPLAGPVGEAEYFLRPDLAKSGYALHGPTVSAMAWWPMSQEEVAGINLIFAQNRGH
jgi:hypothetical protein